MGSNSSNGVVSGLNQKKECCVDRNIYLRGKKNTPSQLLKMVQTHLSSSILCPLPQFVKTEDILTSDKLGKVAITLKDDKQMEDKPCSSAFVLSSVEPEGSRKEIVVLFMLASSITCHQEIVYVTLLILTISLVKKVCVCTQYILLSTTVLCGALLHKSGCFYHI